MARKKSTLEEIVAPPPPPTLDQLNEWFLPPLRSFRILRDTGVETVVTAHAVERDPAGSLVFYVQQFQREEDDTFKPHQYMRRAIAAGTWTDYEEVVFPVGPVVASEEVAH